MEGLRFRPARELIAEMEALKGSSESPPRLAERIRDLRAQWKTISQGAQVDADADWQRFNQAAAIAYEPCRIHFEAQAAARAENVARCGQLLARVQRFETAQAHENPDWRLMSEVLHEAPLEWRRVGPVDRSAVRPIKAEFDAALERLRTRLTAWHAQNETRKRALPHAQAQALLAETDSRIATDGAAPAAGGGRWGLRTVNLKIRSGRNFADIAMRSSRIAKRPTLSWLRRSRRTRRRQSPYVLPPSSWRRNQALPCGMERRIWPRGARPWKPWANAQGRGARSPSAL